MAEDVSRILQNANCMFNEQNYKQAEELYTKFISSCLQSRYCGFRGAASACHVKSSHVKFWKFTVLKKVNKNVA